MPPNSAPPPITPGHDPYGFITNPSPPGKRSKISLPSGSSTTQRALIVAGGVIILIVVASVIASLLGSSGKQNTNNLILAAQQQEELRRVSEIGIKDSRGSTAKNLAATAFYTLESDKVILKPIVSKAKKVDAKLLAKGKDPATTTKLTEAKQANLFDDVFTELLKSEMREYQATLRKVHDSASKTNKPVIAEQFRNIGLLIGE